MDIVRRVRFVWSPIAFRRPVKNLSHNSMLLNFKYLLLSTREIAYVADVRSWTEYTSGKTFPRALIRWCAWIHKYVDLILTTSRKWMLLLLNISAVQHLTTPEVPMRLWDIFFLDPQCNILLGIILESFATKMSNRRSWRSKYGVRFLLEKIPARI